MSVLPIFVQLSKFEQIEILRAEIELREEELKTAEKQIRVILFELERQKYLQTVHQLFQQLQAPEQAGDVPQLNANREALNNAIQSMKAALGALEADTAGQSAPASRGLQAQRAGGAAAPSAVRRAKFDSFDDFKATRPGPGGEK